MVELHVHSFAQCYVNIYECAYKLFCGLYVCVKKSYVFLKLYYMNLLNFILISQKKKKTWTFNGDAEYIQQ